MKRETSEKLFDRARQLIPGGVNSPVRAFGSVGGSPVYFAKGSGGTFLDADGNTYVDFCLSWGPLILGHASPSVVAAVVEAAAGGLSFGACHEREVRMAEAVLAGFPFHQKARFVSSGTEAVMTAARLARGCTGRSLILKFDGCYHGHVDSLLVSAGSGLATQAIASSAGVPPEVAACTIVAPLDDEEALRAVFAARGSEIAAAIIEPLPANAGLLPQRLELIRALRELTRANGSLLIFDEVISGFRLRYGGYGAMTGVEPDITTLGKIIGGGMPVGAVLSSSAIMDQLAPVGKVYQAGTLSGNPVSLAAGLATLGELRGGSVYDRLESVATRLSDRLSAHGIKHVRVGSILWLYLGDNQPPRKPSLVEDAALKRFNAIHGPMLDVGYYMPPSAWEVMFLCTEHTPGQVDGFADVLARELGR